MLPPKNGLGAQARTGINRPQTDHSTIELHLDGGWGENRTHYERSSLVLQTSALPLEHPIQKLVAREGLEPSSSFERTVLSGMRLPVSPPSLFAI